MSRTVTAPLERIKIIAQTRGSVSMSGELARMYRADGYRGLFVGNGANCMRVFPMAGIVTIVYLNALKLTPADNELDLMEPVYRGGCAAFAGLVGQAATYPMDVARTRMTVHARYIGMSMAKCASTIATNEGARGLYKGLFPTMAAVAPFLACQTGLLTQGVMGGPT